MSVAAAADFRARVAERRGAVDLLVLSCGHERFALPLAAVREVVDVPDASALVGHERGVHDVVSTRDGLAAVYVAGEVLGAPTPRGEAVLAVLRDGARLIGLLADAAHSAPAADLAAAHSFEGDDVVLAVLRLDGALVGIVDADALAAACRRSVPPFTQLPA
jgi:chemotaxis signal transduction protein